MIKLFLSLCFAHILSDFYLQWKPQCDNKKNKGLKGWGFWFHVFMVGALSWCIFLDWTAWWVVLGIMVSHGIIDRLKYLVDDDDQSVKSLVVFLVDQLLHVGILLLMTYIWIRKNPYWEPCEFINALLINHPLRVYVIFAMLLALKPANILILDILHAYKVKTDSSTTCDDHGSFHSGELIGWLERGLMLIFVVLGQFEAIGFLIAGKSILRFGETAHGSEKSEYVLAGTLLSLFISLGLGLVVRMIS